MIQYETGSFPVWVIEKDWSGMSPFTAIRYDGTDILEIDRDIAENLCTDIDPAGFKINKREVAEIVVMVVPMDHPPVK